MAKIQHLLDAVTKENAPAANFGARTYSALEFDKQGLVRRNPEHEEMLRIRNTLDEDSCCSFHEWSVAGYRIKKGQKSHFKDILGVLQFTKEQVYKSK